MVAIRTPNEINKIEKSCKYVAEVLYSLGEMLKPGMTTLELDRKSREMTESYGATPAFLNYGNPPFPAAVCTSLNEEVVHGIPSDKVVLKEGDILSIDFGLKYDGYYGDSAYTFLVGKVNNAKKQLCEVTKKALDIGIEQLGPGNHLGDASYAIQTYVESNGYSVVREFVGHGIGTNLHEDPQIPNYGKKGTGILLKSGMIFAIEPMVNMGKYAVRVLDDGWTAVTEDGSPSAHFEHTIVITDNGPKILTHIN